jgi:hypothetical protein
VESAKLLVLLNLSFSYLKLDRPATALRYGEQALIIDQRNAKALFRCGQVSGGGEGRAVPHKEEAAGLSSATAQLPYS